MEQNKIKELEIIKNQLEEKKYMLDAALNIIGEGVWDWDITTNQVKHNAQWCRMFKIDDTNLEHHIDFFISILSDDDKPKVNKRIQNALKTKSKYFSIHKIVCSDGEVKWVEDRGEIIKYDEEGHPIRMIGCVHDITDRIRLQEQEKILEKQTRLAALGEMIGNIAHQWRQPLSVISALVDSLELYYSINNLSQKVVQDTRLGVKTQIDYLSQTIEDFRNFIRNDRKSQSFYLSQVVKKTLSLVHAVINKNYIKIRSNSHDDAKCIGFESEMLQVLLNIINNAKDAFISNDINETERYIIIDSIKNGDFIELHIQDSAGGVPKDIINRIFEPYFTTKDDDLGTGLGLHMSKKIVEDSQGEISVQNTIFEIDGVQYMGAEFIIKFPIIK